jgi:hypothetical protein
MSGEFTPVESFPREETSLRVKFGVADDAFSVRPFRQYDFSGDRIWLNCRRGSQSALDGDFLNLARGVFVGRTPRMKIVERQTRHLLAG